MYIIHDSICQNDNLRSYIHKNIICSYHKKYHSYVFDKVNNIFTSELDIKNTENITYYGYNISDTEYEFVLTDNELSKITSIINGIYLICDNICNINSIKLSYNGVDFIDYNKIIINTCCKKIESNILYVPIDYCTDRQKINSKIGFLMSRVNGFVININSSVPLFDADNSLTMLFNNVSPILFTNNKNIYNSQIPECKRNIIYNAYDIVGYLDNIMKSYPVLQCDLHYDNLNKYTTICDDKSNANQHCICGNILMKNGIIVSKNIMVYPHLLCKICKENNKHHGITSTCDGNRTQECDCGAYLIRDCVIIDGISPEVKEDSVYYMN